MIQNPIRPSLRPLPSPPGRFQVIGLKLGRQPVCLEFASTDAAGRAHLAMARQKWSVVVRVVT